MVRRRLVAPLLVVGAALLALPVSAAGRDRKFADFFARHSLTPPAATRLTVCYGFGCRRRMQVVFTDADRKAVNGIIANAAASARAERAAVARTVAWFDRRVGPLTGTARRVARADFRALDAANNFDCIDTSTNTTGLLLLFAGWKLLRYHDVGLPYYRGNLLFGQTPHNTAVLIERTSGRVWAIDMWTTGYGDRPDVMPVERWMQEN